MFILLWVTASALSFFLYGKLSHIDPYVIPYITSIFVMSFNQWIVLRLYSRKYNWWVIATMLGVILTEFAPYIPLYDIVEPQDPIFSNGRLLVHNATASFIQGGIKGIIASFPQWLVLRRHISKSGWWILAGTFGWILSSVMPFLTKPSGLFIFALKFGISYGLVTGIALVWLLRQPPKAGKLQETGTIS